SRHLRSSRPRVHRALHPFPTRRSSDLYFADAYAVVQRYVGGLREQLFTRHDGEQWHIPIDRLASLDPRPLLLYELFKPFGFTETDRKSTRLNSSHVKISYAVFCLKKKP